MRGIAAIATTTTEEIAITDARPVATATTTNATAAVEITESKSILFSVLIVVKIVVPTHLNRTDTTNTTAADTTDETTRTADASPESSALKTSILTSKKPRWPTPYPMSTSTATSSTGTDSSGSPGLSAR